MSEMVYVYGALLLHQAKRPIDRNSLAAVVMAADIMPNVASLSRVVETLADTDLDAVLTKLSAPEQRAPTPSTESHQATASPTPVEEPEVAINFENLFG